MDEIHDLKNQIERIKEENIKLKSDSDKMLKKINETNLELNEMKTKHNDEIQQYMDRLKDNDKVVQDRINQFDKDMLELQSKLKDIKSELHKTAETQLEQEKTKMKINNEDLIKSKDKMNENIQKLNNMLEKS